MVQELTFLNIVLVVVVSKNVYTNRNTIQCGIDCLALYGHLCWNEGNIG